MNNEINSGSDNLSTAGKSRRKAIKKAAYAVPVVAALSMADMATNTANAYFPTKPYEGPKG